jgi:putative endonuclease
VKLLPLQRRNPGRAYETLAIKFLQRRGLQLVTRNYQCRGGEIDLIVKQGNTLIFVEVRYRQASTFGSAVESVTRAKQARIVHCARHYLMRHPNLSGCDLRFDIIGICQNGNSRGYQVEWLDNAFAPGD